MDTSPFLCPAIWWRIAPDHPRAILHQTRRPDCGTAERILYSHSPAINIKNNRLELQSCSGYFFTKNFTSSLLPLMKFCSRIDCIFSIRRIL